MSFKSIDVDALVESYAPERESFTVTLPKGDVLHFRVLTKYGQLQDFKRQAVNWWSRIKSNPGKLAGFVPDTAEEAIAAYTLSEMSIEPTRLEHLDALKLLKAPWLVEFLLGAIDSENRTMMSILESEAVESAKKGSGATTGSGSGSPSPVTRSASTPKPSRQKSATGSGT